MLQMLCIDSLLQSQVPMLLKKLRYLNIGGENFGQDEMSVVDYLETLKTLIHECQYDLMLDSDQGEDDSISDEAGIIALLEKAWKPHMTSDAAMPEISFVDEELVRKSRAEKVI
jgi:hypothetical protein